MVLKSADKRETVTGRILFVVLLGIMVATFTAVMLFLVKALGEEPVNEVVVEEAAEDVVEPEPEPEVVLPEKVDFQPVVDEWAASVGGNRSVMIYDLERDELAGVYNEDESYQTASLYKLFVVYEGYRRVQSGEWQANDPAGSTGYTILECLDLAIRESYSPCAETLWGYIGHAALDEIMVNDFGITDSDISHLVSDPADIMKIMKIFYEHKEIKDDELVTRMKDSFLNQPPTTYDWRQGLPSGFSRANVYNKVGWDYNPSGGYWNIYHDAAIVEFPGKDRHFIVVVMTNRVPFQRIRDFGRLIEDTFLQD